MRFRYFSHIILVIVSLLLSGCAGLRLPGLATMPPPSILVTKATETGSAPEISQTRAVDKPTSAATMSLPLEPTLLPTDTPGAQASLGNSIPLPKYVIDASMDYDAKSLDVHQTIEFTNTSGSEISGMLLGVQPNLITGVFSLLDLRMDNQPVTDYTLDGQRLGWKLGTPIKAGETAHIQIEFKLALPEVEQGDPNIVRPKIFGVTNRQVNLTDWYPMLLPYYPDKGWQLANAWFYGEHLVYPLARFDVTIHFVDPENAPVIAASAEAQSINGGFHYIQDGGRDFVMAMGRQFKVLSAEVEGVKISSYYYQGNDAPAQAVLDATGKALKTYSDLFGPYPHKSLAAVQGDFNDGMEFDGLFFLSNGFYNLYDGTPNNYLVMVAAHETSHQWWFGRVASDQANQPWMDEALATYCEKIFYEKNYPDSLNWWWSYRIDFYQPEGKIDGDVASYAGFMPYTNAVYRQGARFLDELRHLTGDQDFFDFLKDYATRMDGKIATPGDFFRILRQHTSAALGDLLAKYFSNPPG